MKLTLPFRIAFLLIFLFSGGLTTLSLQAQKVAGDDIIGVWLVQDKDAQVRIYRSTNGKYYGKVHWLKEPNDNEGKPRVDIHNPDESLRATPIMGKVIMKDFSYDPEAKEWIDGTIYQSQTGKTYTGYMELNADGTLYMKGFVMGMRFLGKSNIWTRVN
jgi:uncharacterized protein (DUF2147 family)